jgi:hypothetical protein
LAPFPGPSGFGFATASGATPRLIIARRAVILTIGTATHGIQKKSPEGPLETLTPSPRTISVVGEAKDGMKIVPLVERIGTTEG